MRKEKKLKKAEHDSAFLIHKTTVPTKVRSSFFTVLRVLACAQATGANVLVRRNAVDFYLYFMNVSVESTLGVAVGVADVVACRFAFSANNTYSAH